MFSKIRGFKVFNKDFDSFISYILERTKKEKVHIVSGNPEVLTFGEKDEELNDDYIIPPVFDKRVSAVVAEAVKKCAYEQGITR